VPGSVYVEWRLGVDMVEGRNEVLVHWPLPLLLIRSRDAGGLGGNVERVSSIKKTTEIMV
jgi:hypothetical protein